MHFGWQECGKRELKGRHNESIPLCALKQVWRVGTLLPYPVLSFYYRYRVLHTSPISSYLLIYLHMIVKYSECSVDRICTIGQPHGSFEGK